MLAVKASGLRYPYVVHGSATHTGNTGHTSPVLSSGHSCYTLYTAQHNTALAARHGSALLGLAVRGVRCLLLAPRRGQSIDAVSGGTDERDGPLAARRGSLERRADRAAR